MRDLAAVFALKHFILVRKYLHGLLVFQKIIQVIANESANALFGASYPRQAVAEIGQNRRKSMLLDQIEKPVFRAEVVIHARQRHAGGTGKVAHGRTLVAFVAKNFSGVFEDLAQLAIKTRLGRLTRYGSMGTGSGSC